MGGKKRKILIEKIEKKDWKSVAFSKRRVGLFSKASKLCSLSGEKIAILVTPISLKSHVPFYSFGHSSVDSVVSAFLTNQLPRDDNSEQVWKELGFWWEDERLAKSENPKELSDAMESISSMLRNLKGLHSEAVENRRKNNNLKDVGTHQNQTLIFQSCSASKADSPGDIEGFIKKSEEKDQIVANCSNYRNNDVSLYQDLDQNQTPNLQSGSASICIQDSSHASFEHFIKNREKLAISDNNVNKDVVLDGTQPDLYENKSMNLQSTCATSTCIQESLPSGEEEDPILAISDNNNNYRLLDGYNKELGLDEIFNFDQHLSVLDENQNELDLDHYFDFSMDDASTNANMCFDYEGVEDE